MNDALFDEDILLNKKEKIKGATVIKTLYGLCSVAFGFLLTGDTVLPVNVSSPLIAYACASPEYPVFAVFGAFIRLFIHNMFVSSGYAGEILPCAESAVFVAASAAVALRLILRFISGYVAEKKPVFSRTRDSLTLRVLIAATACAGVSLYRVAGMLSGGTAQDFAPEVLIGELLFVCSGTALAALYCFFTDTEYRYGGLRFAGACAVYFTLTGSLSFIRFEGFSVSLAVGIAVTLIYAFRHGGREACIIGIFCGLTLSPELALYCGGIGLLGGAFAGIDALSAAVTSAAVMGVAAFCTDIGVSVYDFAYSAILAVALSALYCFNVIKREPIVFENICARMSEKLAKAERTAALDRFGAAMMTLSEILRSFSDHGRQARREPLEKICSETFFSVCRRCGRDCPMRDINSFAGKKAFENTVTRLMNTGRLNREVISTEMNAVCPNADELIRIINGRFGEVLKEACEGTGYEGAADDCGAACGMLPGIFGFAEENGSPDMLLTQELKLALNDGGISFSSATVCGIRKKSVFISRNTPSGDDGEEIAGICSEVCGCTFSPPEIYKTEHGDVLRLTGIPEYSVRHAALQKTKEGEHVNGDCVSHVQSSEGIFYSFICDGMGSGEKAAAASQLCVSMLKSVLPCHDSDDSVIGMLGSVLCRGKHECFSTLDLVKIDLYNGKAEFIKCGASPSYIMRGGRLYKISSGTLPLGVLPRTSAERTVFDLVNGDMIMMCSDGVAQDFEIAQDSPEWLVSYLSGCVEGGVEETAEKIMDKACVNNARSDDMSVLVIKVNEVARGSRQIKQNEAYATKTEEKRG